MLAKSRRYRRVLRGDWVSRSFNASILPQHFISDALCKFFSLCKSKPSKSLVGCFILSISLPAFLTGPKKDLSSNLFSSAVGTENVHRMKAGRMELRKKKKTAPDKDIWGIYIDISWIEVKIAYQEDAFLQNDSKHYTPNVVGKIFFFGHTYDKKIPPHTHNPGRKPRH